jgi:hypothetical protein
VQKVQDADFPGIHVGDRLGGFRLHSSISAATGIPTTVVFYSLRLLLGACEAGFFPGIVFYLTLWFPAVYRARVISLFVLWRRIAADVPLAGE